ncbi:LytR/AlgR family response regulator transcription factor [Tellurirhabdus rosea]|uniref:LytR/AlgR family response regulator transcription factor n=1 Tax=Tellurirhabdus rosea TaxID=2674997 RepID=UPI002256CD7D|nr:LytTR family DNA-binding domain-containing protein [Tellurirhabdus rosea]
MLTKISQFFNRPLAEDFSFRYQFRLALQAGFYVALLLFFLGGPPDASRVLSAGLFGLGCFAATVLANCLIPALLPRIYNEESWTVWRQILHTLFVLLCISAVNQTLLWALNQSRPPFWAMYVYVTVIGFFPITLGVLLMERRRLKRNIEHARTANEQIDRLHHPVPEVADEMPEVLELVSTNGKERLSLLPNQLLYVESTGNYVEVHYLNFMFPQTATLRSTLKEIEEALANQPQFLRCHRAFIINLKAVEKTEGNARGYQLTLSGSQRQIPVSRSYLEAFDERMQALS